MRTTTAAGLALVATLAALPLAAQESYRLSGSRVAVYNLVGELEVVPGSGSEVVVTVRRGGSDAARLEAEVVDIGGAETLVVRYPSDEVLYDRVPGRNSTTTLNVRDDGTWGGRRGGGDRVRVRTSGNGLQAWADLRIEVPEGRQLLVRVAMGESSVRGVRADVDLGVSSGRVEVADVVGDVSVDTGSGSVTVTQVQGEVLVDTGSGSVRVEGVRGPAVSIDTGSGTVEGADIEADAVEVDTGSGGVSLARVAARSILVDTGSGGVDIEVTTASLETVEVDTGSGGVTLRLPDGVDAEIEADSGSGGIDVDFPLELRSQRRNYLRGVMGTGRGRIVIDTGSGRIRILRN